MATATASSTRRSFVRRIPPGTTVRRGKALREGLGPATVKEEAKEEAKARPAVARRVSGGREARAEVSGAPLAPAKGTVGREDRRRVALAGAGAPEWGRRARSGLWSAPCRSTPIATGSSTAMN